MEVKGDAARLNRLSSDSLLRKAEKMRKSRITRSRNSASYNSLEERRLLAGDVTLFQAEDIAYLRGDRADNSVLITANEDGQVVVSGVGDTTINGESEVVLDSADSTIGRLGIHMGPGNDTLMVEGIDIARRAIVFAGTGDDAIGFSNVTTGNNLVANPWQGNDSVSLDNVEVGGRLVAYTGAGDDTVGIDNTTVNGRTLIGTGAGNDRLALRNTVHNAELFAFTGTQDDFVSVDSVTTNQFSAMVTGYGDDDLVVTNSTFNAAAYASGRNGTDNLEQSGNEFGDRKMQRHFEGEDVENETERRDEIFADLTNIGIKPSNV